MGMGLNLFAVPSERGDRFAMLKAFLENPAAAALSVLLDGVHQVATLRIGERAGQKHRLAAPVDGDIRPRVLHKEIALGPGNLTKIVERDVLSIRQPEAV